MGFRPVASNVRAARISAVVKFLQLCILCYVDQDGAGPTAARNIKCLGKNSWNFVRLCYLVIPFCHWCGDVDYISFLECVSTEQVSKDLSCYAYDGCTVDHRIGQPGYKVCRPWPAGCKNDSCTAAAAGESLGRMNSTLFMPD